MKLGRNWRKLLRHLNKDQIQERFDNHNKLHEFEVDYLFDVKKLNKEQYRWLMKGYRYFTIFDIESINFNARMGFVICWYALRWDILTDEKEMIYDSLQPSDMNKGYKTKNFDFDIRILQTLAAELSQADVVAGHYISKFDSARHEEVDGGRAPLISASKSFTCKKNPVFFFVSSSGIA